MKNEPFCHNRLCHASESWHPGRPFWMPAFAGMTILNGVSLIELLITLALMSILTLISIPLYTAHFIHERRIEAEITLEQAASALEDYFLMNNTYKNATLLLLKIPNEVAHQHYQMQLTEVNDTAYTLKAISIQNDDPQCGTLTLNALGEKGINGYGTLMDCW